MPKGKSNLYTCTACSGRVLIIDIDEGTTPFMIGCRVNPEDGKILDNSEHMNMDQLREAMKKATCKGMMHSSFYRLPAPFYKFGSGMKPTYEFYKPSLAEYVKLSRITAAEHVDKGGLLLRPITAAGENLWLESFGVSK